MLIPFDQVLDLWQPKHPPRILHCGAHLCEERDAYEDGGVQFVTWIEANPHLIDPIRAYLCEPRPIDPLGWCAHRVIHAVIGDQDNREITLHIAENTHNSSVLNPGTIDVNYVEDYTAMSSTVDAIVKATFQPTMLNLDLQGIEFHALLGATHTLQGTEVVYLEVAEEPVYEDAPHWSEIDKLLRSAGFRLAQMEMTRSGDGWGDAIWLRKGVG